MSIRITLALTILVVLWDRSAALAKSAHLRAEAVVRPVAAILTGTIKSADGKELEGVVVSAQAYGSTITTSVFTDQDGLYFFPPLENRRYRIWAQAVGFQTANAEARVEASGKVRQNFTLEILQDFTMQLTGAEWVDALPSDTRENRRLKELVQHECSGCHTPAFPLQNRFDENGWRSVLNAMQFTTGDNAYWYDKPSRNIQHFANELAPYLATVRGPGPSPMKFHPLPRPTGDAARAVVTEYDISPPGTPDEVTPDHGTDWMHGTPAARYNHKSHDVAVDFDGNAWITQWMANKSRSYAKVDARTGKITNFVIPSPGNDYVPATHAIVTGLDGSLWVNVRWQPEAEPQDRTPSLGRIDPKTGKAEIFDPPKGMSAIGGHVDVDTKGKIWCGTYWGVLRLDPDTRQFTEFRAITPEARAYGLAGDSEGNAWWAELTADNIGRSDIETGKSREVALKPRSDLMELATEEDRKWYLQSEKMRIASHEAPRIDEATTLWTEMPRRLGGDHYDSGHFVWVADFFGQNIARLDIRTSEVKYYEVPVPYANPYDVDVDKNHMVWVALSSADEVAKFDPANEKWTLYKLPTLGTEPRNIAVDQKTGDVWIPYWRAGKVARLQFRTARQMTDAKVEIAAMKQ